MADIIEIKASARPRAGKGAARSVRREGRIPGVIYGDSKAPVTISVLDAELRQRIQAGRFLTTIMDIDLEGASVSMTKFPSALSAGSHHDDWFTAMLPSVVACFRRPELARPLFEEAAECLAIIQQAYRRNHSLA